MNCVHSQGPRRDKCHDARWFRSQRDKLADMPYGYCEGTFQESIRTHRYCQGWLPSFQRLEIIQPCLRLTASSGTWKDLSKDLANLNYLTSNIQKVYTGFIFTSSLSLNILFTGKKVFWHSSAHVLGESAERHYGCHLCIGPPIEDGFFYEMAIEDRWKPFHLISSIYPYLPRYS